MTLERFLQVDEGSLLWLLDCPNVTGPRASERPTLLFIHAAVADHTLWDCQVEYLVTKGWNVLRYDILGYGKSHPSEAYLEASPRPPVKHYQHTAQVVRNLLYKEQTSNKVIVIGLSRGGAIAVDFAIAFPDLVCGLAVVAGGLSGFDSRNLPKEDELFAQEERLSEARDSDGLARLRVRIWGDGPLQEEGRVDYRVRQSLYTWCKDIAVREHNGTGGSAIEDEELDPPAASRLVDIAIPVAVALGTLDESSTNAAMRHITANVTCATAQEFDSAHMVNLERPDAFNAWLEAWLVQFDT
ncbi:hypothetical protein MMC30_007829 [Trapelia coarctata]|nr:hypothetical protein [Trapelia coarctata]